MMGRFFRFVVALAAILAIFPLYTHFKALAAPTPPGVYLAGVDVSNLKDIAAMQRQLEPYYAQPVEAIFAGQRLILHPEQVDFQLDVEQMVMESQRVLNSAALIDIFARYTLGLEQQRRDIPIRFSLNNDKLRAWLEEMAAAYNTAPTAPRALAPIARWSDGYADPVEVPDGYVGLYQRDWTWMPGSSGYTLDVEASQPRLIAALTQLPPRSAELAVIETAASAPTLGDVSAVISTTLSTFPGFGAVYIHDLVSDEEAGVDEDVSFSGMSTLKIAIAAAIMQKLPNGVDKDDAKSQQIGQWLDYALGESNNYAANQLVIFLGDGDIRLGTQRFTEFMRSLGFENTYMQSGYDAQAQLRQIPTPGNQRQDWNTNPDSNLQSTPKEMGLILSAIYRCMEGKGLLLEIYPNDFTSDECRTILFYMTHDEFQELIWAGLPGYKKAWIVHKHGFAFESHSDVALIWGPTGPYVISIFLYRKGWMDWNSSNGAMQSVSRITWNFFEFKQKEQAIEAPPALILAPPPGYQAIKQYIPVASTGFR